MLLTMWTKYILSPGTTYFSHRMREVAAAPRWSSNRRFARPRLLPPHHPGSPFLCTDHRWLTESCFPPSRVRLELHDWGTFGHRTATERVGRGWPLPVCMHLCGAGAWLGSSRPGLWWGQRRHFSVSCSAPIGKGACFPPGRTRDLPQCTRFFCKFSAFFLQKIEIMV